MDFSALYNSFFTLSVLYAERQKGSKKKVFERKEPRPADALLLLTNSTAIYSMERKNLLHIPHGALVYIPRGCTYTVENYSVDERDKLMVMLFDFVLHKSDISISSENEILTTVHNDNYISLGYDEISIVDMRPKIYERLFASLIDTYNSYMNKQAALVSVYHAAYSILDALIKNQYSHSASVADTSIVDASMKYLSRIGEQEKSISEIAELCCVSISYLEKKFKKITGMSPIEYRLECKIMQAKTMLANKNMNVAEISDMLGFCDSGYMCRIFKKKTGMSPKQYQNTILQ